MTMCTSILTGACLVAVGAVAGLPGAVVGVKAVAWVALVAAAGVMMADCLGMGAECCWPRGWFLEVVMMALPVVARPVVDKVEGHLVAGH